MRVDYFIQELIDYIDVVKIDLEANSLTNKPS